MKLDKTLIRQMVMASHGDAIRELLLTENDIKTVTLVGHKGMTTREVADFYECSIQMATNTLKRLYFRGYLTRYEANDPTGGIYHFYKRAVI